MHKVTYNGSYQLEILPKGRSVADEYEHPNTGETFIEGRKRSDYVIRIKNNTPKRAMFVISVDGLSILSGNRASEHDNGYVLDRYTSAEIPGWRLSAEQVAKFYFATVRGSYSAQSGNGTANVGVIGCVVYEEYMPISWQLQPMVQPWPPQKYDPYDRGDRRITWNGPSTGTFYPGAGFATSSTSALNAIGSSSVKGPSAEGNVGTGFGAPVDYTTGSTHFTKGKQVAKFVIYYDSAQNLERMGIVLKRSNNHYKNRDPFPRDGCKPPANWRG